MSAHDTDPVWDIPMAVEVAALEALDHAIDNPFPKGVDNFFLGPDRDRAMRVLLRLNMQGWNLTRLPEAPSGSQQ